MADPQHLAIFRQGINTWNTWRTAVPETTPDLRWENLSLTNLRGIDLSNANLSRTNLSGAMLSRADLSGARLIETSLNEANLSGADLSRAVLKRANLSRANLNRTNLSESDLHQANLSKTDLFGTVLHRANLSEAFFYETSFRDTHLEQALGLGRCRHLGPSSIDHHTLARTTALPTTFLRGCGLQAWEIEATRLYDPDLSPTQIAEIARTIEQLRAATPIQLHNLFVSYSHADADFYAHLERFLETQHVLYWPDVHDTPPGPFPKIVTRAMRPDPTILLVLSEHSVGRGWVEFEVDQARKLEQTLHRTVLCPVALDDSWKKAPWPDDLKERLASSDVIDLSDWRDEDLFPERFEQVLVKLNLFYERRQEPGPP